MYASVYFYSKKRYSAHFWLPLYVGFCLYAKYVCYCVCLDTWCRRMASLFPFLKCMAISSGVEIRFGALLCSANYSFYISPFFVRVLSRKRQHHCFQLHGLTAGAAGNSTSFKTGHNSCMLTSDTYIPAFSLKWPLIGTGRVSLCVYFNSIGGPGWFDTCRDLNARPQAGTHPLTYWPDWIAGCGEGKNNGGEKLTTALGNMWRVSKRAKTSSQVGRQLFHLALSKMWRSTE